jgi:hypothetical protein
MNPLRCAEPFPQEKHLAAGSRQALLPVRLSPSMQKINAHPFSTVRLTHPPNLLYLSGRSESVELTREI